jgi:hypothetical protein
VQRERLAIGASDIVREIRKLCLGALVSRGDASARDTLLQMLSGPREDLETALHALRESFARDPELARAAFDILEKLARNERVAITDPRAIDRAIGQIPLPVATQFLVDRAATATGMVSGLPAARWYMQQAGNTGPPGRAFLRARWDDETDLARRFDLIMAGSFEKTDDVRIFLEHVIESERATPWEILFAADILVHLGPASHVAPLLKRATLRVSDPRVRPALHCLLWAWYGPDR